MNEDKCNETKYQILCLDQRQSMTKELTREEIELWDKIIIVLISRESTITAVYKADKLIKERRERFTSKKNEGPYR